MKTVGRQISKVKPTGYLFHGLMRRASTLIRKAADVPPRGQTDISSLNPQVATLAQPQPAPLPSSTAAGREPPEGTSAHPLGVEEKAALADEEARHRLDRVQAVWGAPQPQGVKAERAAYPLSHPVVRAAMNRRASGDDRHDSYHRLRELLLNYNWTLPVSSAVSLCCGAGVIERGLFERGIIERCVGYDLAEPALENARAQAAAANMHALTYERRDLEQEGLGKSDLDLVIAHDGLHHLSRLEAVFDAVRDALRPGGVFHIEEFVGPDRFQWTERQIHEMTAWLQSVPERFRITPSGGVKTAAGRATIEQMIAFDPTEAVRSSAIERLVGERFEIIERRALGGTLAMMALAEIAQNFDPDSPEDCSHVERLLAREDELIATGEIASDFVVLVARRPE
jgi:SAM-dependent methyltransferase